MTTKVKERIVLFFGKGMKRWDNVFADTFSFVDWDRS